MAWPLICLSLLTVFSGSFSQPVLTQLPSMSASLGATARLTCTLSSQHSTYTIRWYQQRPGKSPQYVMYVTKDGGGNRGDGIPDRFSGSSSGADRYLSIRNMQPEDEADYYCGAGYGSGGSYGLHSDTFSQEVRQKLPLPARPSSTPGPRPLPLSPQGWGSSASFCLCLCPSDSVSESVSTSVSISTESDDELVITFIVRD